MKKRIKKKKLETSDFLLEIGTEEIPSGYLDSAQSNLRTQADKFLKEELLDFTCIETYATPRRLVLFIKGLAGKQRVQETVRRGPSYEVSYSDNGEPTEKLLGFMKGLNLKEKDIRIVNDEKGKKYVCAKIKPSARSAQHVLQGIAPKLISKIDFPKSMVWESHLIRFARPIRWILCLYGPMPINFTLGTIRSNDQGPSTRGHRFLKKEPIKVKDASQYFNLIKKSFVVLDQDERKQKIEKDVKNKLSTLKAKDIINRDLIDTIKYLVEYPVAFTGEFDKEYLRLPSEIVVNTMTKNQRILAVCDSKNRLMNKFIAILNGRSTKQSQVKKYYEGVLDAKLKDSIFFLQEDTKTNLNDRRASLKDVIFQKDVGSFFDKTERLVAVSGFIADTLKLDSKQKENIKKAAEISKVDLTTQMVKEFPDLQGVVGAEYARMEDYDKAIVNAISGHYLPRSANDKLPEDRISMILSLSDKLDNLVSHFVVGIQPTGSEDPYGLRRNAAGFINVWLKLDHDFMLSLDNLINTCLKLLLKKNQAPEKKRLVSFIKERFYALFNDHPKDLLDSVLSSNFDNLTDVQRRIIELSQIRDKDSFEQSRVIVERTANMLKSLPGADVKLSNVDPSLFKEKEEEDLNRIFISFRDSTDFILRSKKYKEFTEIFARDFFRKLNSFFDVVRVNVEDEKIKLNRLALLAKINKIYSDNVANLALIVKTEHK